MTADEYLKQIGMLDDLIRSDLRELERLKDLAVSIPSQDLSRDRVMGGKKSKNANYTNIAHKIADLSREIDAEVDSLIDLKREARMLINSLPSCYRVVLRKRYLDRMSVEQIAENIGMGTTWVKDNLKAGRTALEKIIPQSVRKRLETAGQS